MIGSGLVKSYKNQTVTTTWIATNPVNLAMFKRRINQPQNRETSDSSIISSFNLLALTIHIPICIESLFIEPGLNRWT